MDRRARALTVYLLLFLLWAGIYLPALGETELKGEEPRRIFPGLMMLQNGDFLRPMAGDTPYLRKPPLVNWAVAASTSLLGRYDELAYRLPSVLAVLGLVLGTAAFTRRWLGENGAFLAGVFILTNISMLEKGRLAEIEPIYIACSGLAIAWWLPAFARGEGPWRKWLVPGIFLGLGMLAKGPLHLLYFYAVVIGAAWGTRRLRATLLHPAHFVCVALTAGIFALWAVPYAIAGPGEAAADAEKAQVGAAWITQLTSRLGFDDFKLGNWLLNMPRGLMNLLPWALFFPLFWNRRWLAALSGENEHRLLRGALWGAIAAFVVISILPGSLERYTLPLLVPVFILLARVMGAEGQQPGSEKLGVAWHRVNLVLWGIVVIALGALPVYLNYQREPVGPWWVIASGFCTLTGLHASWHARKPWEDPAWRWATLGLATSLLITGGLLMYYSATGLLRPSDNLRPTRHQIVQVFIKPGDALWVQDSGWRTFWVYLMPEARFFRDLKTAPFPEDRRLFLLVKRNAAERVLGNSRFRGRPGRQVDTLQDKEGDEYALLLFPPKNLTAENAENTEEE